jgi:uncharacterized damage-inducible protein DinB
VITYMSEVLLDVHERSHRCLAKLMEHCRALTPEELNREIEGFGYPSIRLQLHHELGAERYWLSVIQGAMILDDDDPAYPTIESLEALRRDVFAATQRYLRGASVIELNTPRTMKTWRGERALVPAHIMVRVSVHLFHHQGQILALCRLLGKPGEGFDYPL